MKGIYVSNGKVHVESEITVADYIKMYHEKEVSALDAIYVLAQALREKGCINADAIADLLILEYEHEHNKTKN